MKYSIRTITPRWDRDLGEILTSVHRVTVDTEKFSPDVVDLILGRERWRAGVKGETDRFRFRRRMDSVGTYYEIRGTVRSRYCDREGRVWWRDERRDALRRLRIHERLAYRWSIAEEMEAKRVRDPETGEFVVWVQDGGRDCDMCESTSRPYPFPADPRAWVAHCEDIDAGAEGPVWYWILDPADVPNARHGSRDLALEAFEDGHPHIVNPGGPLFPDSNGNTGFAANERAIQEREARS